MASTERQRANLKRGGADASTAARLREAKATIREDDERAALQVRDDPEQALTLLHMDLVRGVRALTRRWLAARGDPSRELVQSWTELRRLTSEVAQLRRMRGTVREDADVFWSTLEQRCSSMGLDLKALSATARPIMEMPVDDPARRTLEPQ